MIVYRLTKNAYKNVLSGKGAELHGGRWNSKGKSIIYTCQSRALCTMEIAVHTPLGNLPKGYYLQTIKIPDLRIQEIKTTLLHKDWRNFPHHSSTKSYGNAFISQGKNLVLKVPSAIIQDEYNYLINPNHPYFKKIKLMDIQSFKFDQRLFVR